MIQKMSMRCNEKLKQKEQNNRENIPLIKTKGLLRFEMKEKGVINFFVFACLQETTFDDDEINVTR